MPKSQEATLHTRWCLSLCEEIDFHVVENICVTDLSLGDVHIIPLDDVCSRQTGKDLVRMIDSVIVVFMSSSLLPCI